MGLTIGNYIGIGKNSGISLSQYWSHQSEVLFFGLYSEISGGQMPNKVTGATDFLTVAGVAGSETYQAPHTAAYEAADTDYIWFKTDESQRTTTTAELIGYDFTRTIVYYEDTAPNAIVAIMILSSNVDTAKMRNDFHLSIWWNGLLSIYGRLKSNRGAGKSTWTSESVYADESIALFARMTALGEEPTSARKTVIDTCIKSLISESLFDTQWDVFVMTIGKGIASTKLNWVKDAHNATNGGAGVEYTEDAGYKRGVTGGYLNTNYKPSTQAVILTQNDASFVFKSRGISGTGSSHGVIASHSLCLIHGINGRYCTATSPASAITTVGTENGYRMVSRDNSADFDSAKNTTTEVLTKTSTGKPDYNLFIFCQNNWGTPAGYCHGDEIVDFYAIGKSLTQAKFETLQTIINTYITDL